MSLGFSPSDRIVALESSLRVFLRRRHARRTGAQARYLALRTIAAIRVLRSVEC